jgi:hypothetical protein
MQPRDKKRFENLRSLSPVDAVRAWLDGDFGMGDEPALISAIRRDSRIKRVRSARVRRITEEEKDFETFFKEAPKLNPARTLIKVWFAAFGWKTFKIRRCGTSAIWTNWWMNWQKGIDGEDLEDRE